MSRPFRINHASIRTFHRPTPLDCEGERQAGAFRRKEGTHAFHDWSCARRVVDGTRRRRHGRRHEQVKTGGTLNVDLTTDVDYTDPSLSYLSTGWELEYATCLKLVNYPDANGPRASQLVPEAASGFPKVSKDGKTYDFTVDCRASRSSRTASR